MVERKVCSFCANDIEPGTGKMFVKIDGTIYHYCSSKCQKNMLELKRVPRRTRWTAKYEKVSELPKVTSKAAAKKPAAKKPVKKSKTEEADKPKTSTPVAKKPAAKADGGAEEKKPTSKKPAAKKPAAKKPAAKKE